MPARSPKKSPNMPISNGTKAPPNIPVQRMPENEPWCSRTEFNPNEKMMENITEIKKPVNGKAIKAISVGPYNAQATPIRALKLNNRKIRVEFSSLSNTKPTNQLTSDPKTS